ncbi:MAG: hypothetical protein ABEI77_03130 [Halorientalis sp.]
MALREPAELVDFDAETALAAGQEVAGSALLTCIEYTHQDFHPLYVADRYLDRFRDRDQMTAHFAEILAYCYIDFSDRELFEERIGAAGSVQSFLTRLDHVFVVRLLTDSQGLFVALTPEAPIQDTLDAMRDVMLDTDTAEGSLYQT